MKSVKTKQIAVLAGIGVIIVLLLLANTKLPKKDEKALASEHSGAGANQSNTIETLLENAKKTLKEGQKQELEQLERELKTATDKTAAFKNMVNTMDSLKQPVISAYFVEQAAIAVPVENNWAEAGNRYYVATRFVPDAEKPTLFTKAISCFEKVMELNPANVEAKINLAACYVEGGVSDPMKGITMLREIEKTDSNNVNLQLNFAFFSEKSGQWDKAISRFKKVLKIKPDFIEAYLHLADAYQQKGDTAAAIESLKKYMNQVDDVTIKAEVQNYIDELSKERSLGAEQKK